MRPSRRDAPRTSNAATTTQRDAPSGPKSRSQPKDSARGPEKMQRVPDDDYDRHDDPLLPVAEGRDETATSTTTAAKSQIWINGSEWVGLAIASGACAAFNGVFAKLTTTALTTSLAQSIASAAGVEPVGHIIEFAVRCAFFGLNIIFNGVMWSLFTAALSRGTSTTQVSIINTSTNFMASAFLGLAIFAETLPPLWWLGAAMLIAGNIVIGRAKAPEDDAGSAPRAQTSAADAGAEERYQDAEVEVHVPLVDLDNR